jgi:DNA polymerase elongation subunit (family B)
MDSLVSLREPELEANGTFRFQIFDVHVEDMRVTNKDEQMKDYLSKHVIENLYDSDSDDEDENKKDRNNFKMETVFSLKVFGVTKKGRSVCVHVNDFEPFFYLLLPDEWQNLSIDDTTEKVTQLKSKIIDFLEKDFDDRNKDNDIPRKFEHNISKFNIVNKENFYWFDNNTKLKFVKMRFKNMRGYFNVKRIFLDRKNNPVPFPFEKNNTILFKVYESNIEPMLKFLHTRDLKPSGWCEITSDGYENYENRMTTCNYELVTSFENMSPVELNEVAPYITASFDIECDSLHGDFPLAKKTYSKHAKDIVDGYFIMKNDKDKEHYGNLIAKRFYTIFDYKNYNNDWGVVKLKNGKTRPSKQTIGSVTQKCVEILESKKSKDDTIKKITSVLNRSFPEQEGDPIIQIGTTFRVGKEKVGGHIITLGSCDDIPGVVVESCKNEKDVIKKWFKMIRNVDPDILTGYNINGFDYDYIFTRMIELKMIDNEKSIVFPGITRVNADNKYLKRLGSVFTNVTISSAAMGDNINKFLTTFGRINMDFLKVIRKTYMSLESYKLDSIASTFMNGPVKSVERCEEDGLLRCNVKTVHDLKDREYISFTDGETWISDKYQIMELNREENYFKIDYNEGEEEGMEKSKR